MKYYIGSDHAGYKVKELLKAVLRKKRIPFEDLGTQSEEPVDYPDIAMQVAHRVKKAQGKGILICGTGTGMPIAANRMKGIRAVAASDIYTAAIGKRDNDANVLCLRARQFPFHKTKAIVEAFHSAKFSGFKRHKRRIRKLDQ